MCSQLKEIMNALWVKYLQPKAHSPSQSHSSVCGAAGLGPCSQLRSEQHSKGRVWSKQAFRRICCWSVPEIPQMAEQTMPCVLPTPPRWLQAQASGHSEASNGLLLWKGLGMGWKEKVFNSDNLRYLSAGHGSAWRNEKDMDTQPMTAARVPQLLKLQLAVTEGGLWDKGKGKREVPL